MEASPFARTQMLFGKAAMKTLAKSRVAVFGVGGVGGSVVEALARSGVGQLDLIDSDRVSLTNLNRQILATRKTIGVPKVTAAAERVRDINPDCVVRAHPIFFLPETASQFDFSHYDYIVDAIDTVSGKLELAVQAAACETPIISAMGAGNKVDPTAFEVADLYETSVCPLARIMRRELKKRGVYQLKVVYSKEAPLRPLEEASADKCREQTDLSEMPSLTRRDTPGSNAFVPPVVGLIIAGEVVKDLIRFGRDAP